MMQQLLQESPAVSNLDGRKSPDVVRSSRGDAASLAREAEALRRICARIEVPCPMLERWWNAAQCELLILSPEGVPTGNIARDGEIIGRFVEHVWKSRCRQMCGEVDPNDEVHRALGSRFLQNTITKHFDLCVEEFAASTRSSSEGMFTSRDAQELLRGPFLDWIRRGETMEPKVKPPSSAPRTHPAILPEETPSSARMAEKSDLALPVVEYTSSHDAEAPLELATLSPAPRARNLAIKISSDDRSAAISRPILGGTVPRIVRPAFRSPPLRERRTSEPSPEVAPPPPSSIAVDKLERAWSEQRDLLKLLTVEHQVPLETALAIRKRDMSPTLVELGSAGAIHVDHDLCRAVDRYYGALRDDPLLQAIWFKVATNGRIFFRVDASGSALPLSREQLRAEGLDLPDIGEHAFRSRASRAETAPKRKEESRNAKRGAGLDALIEHALTEVPEEDLPTF